MVPSKLLSLIVAAGLSAGVAAQSSYLVGLGFDQLSNGAYTNSGVTGITNDGIPAGNITPSAGVIGAAINLTGGADEVQAGATPLAGAQARTVSIWVRTTTASGIATAMTFGSNGLGPKWDMDIDCSSGGVFELGVGGGRTTGQGPACNDGNWHLLTAVLPTGLSSLGSVRLFVDGAFAYTNSGTRTINTVGGSVIVGRAANQPAFQSFVGDIDDLAIWSEPLSDEQVQCLHDVAVATQLNYSATTFEQLLEVYRGNRPDLVLGGRLWRRATGLTGSPGLTILPGGGFELVMDASGNGVRAGQPATTSTFGQGCAGTGGVSPSIGATNTPIVGSQNFSIDLSSANPQSFTAVLIGFSRIDLSLGGGCTLYPNQVLSLGQTVTANGTASATVPVPMDPTLVGVTLYAQWAVVDSNGAFGPGLAAFSDGLEFMVGDV